MAESEEEKVLCQLHKLLETYVWLETLETGELYYVQGDDNPPDTNQGFLKVCFTPDGDAWIGVDQSAMPRFRMPGFGGGHYPRVRNALLFLAEAIRLDTEENKKRAVY